MAHPPQALTTPCVPPVALPASALSAGAVERLWAEDRSSLAVCGERHIGVVQFYDARDRGLAGQ